jgi:branched-chain amino acid transport system substrate-binding protein
LAAAGAWTFTLVPDDSIEGAFIAAYAIDSLNATRIAVLYLGDEYGIGLRDGIQGALRHRGRDSASTAMVPSLQCAKKDDTDIFAAIAGAALRRMDPEVVILATGTSHGWCLANVVHQLNPRAWVLGADGVDLMHDERDSYRHVAWARFRAVEFWVPGTDSLNREFVATVRNALGRNPTASEALQYDAYRVVAAAAREAGPRRAAVRDWLASLGGTRPAFPGVTGPISFVHPRVEILRMSEPSRHEP